MSATSAVLVWSVVTMVASAVAGACSNTGHAVASAAVPLGVLVLTAGLVLTDRLFEDRDERFIKSWLAQRLAPGEPAN